MCKVSVIIPVYNAKDFLHESIPSVLNQTLKDIELVCVNDGSTDNSLEILNDYASKDDRVRVIDKENGGCGSARNMALDNARGEYIYFFDPDDFMSPDALEKLYDNAVNNGSDLVIFKIARFEDINDVDYSHPGFEFEKVFKDADFNNFTFDYTDIREHVLNTSFAPWTKLYRKGFLDKYDDFRFPTDVAFDDTPFHVQSMLRAEVLSFVPEFFYFYRFNPNSINNTSSNGMDIFRICDIVEKFLKDNGYYDEFIEEFKYFKIKQAYNYILSTGTEEYFKKAKKELTDIELDDSNIVPQYLVKEYNFIVGSSSFEEYKRKIEGPAKNNGGGADVSVIIPVYNTEEYLDECLKSIANQTLKDIEIICIDDGSTDKSPDILKRYEKEDSRFIVVTQENAGQGNARNRGIDLAKGKYIYFMDSDDTVELNTLEDTFKLAEEKSLDFALFKVINYDEESGELFKNEYYSMDEVTEFVGSDVFSPDDLGELLLKIPVSPVNKLYNREFILSTGARFPEDIIFEDNIFFWDFIFDAERICLLDEYLYTRRLHDSSSTGAGDKRLADTIRVNNMVIDKIKDTEFFDKYKMVIYEDKKITMISHRYRNIRDEYKEYFYNEIVKDFTSMCNQEDYDEFICHLSPRHKKFFDYAIYSADFEEFDLQVSNMFIQDDINDLFDGIDETTEEIANHKKRTDQITKSKSWKITKPLRELKRTL